MAELPALPRRFACTPALRGSRSRPPVAGRSPWVDGEGFPGRGRQAQRPEV